MVTILFQPFICHDFEKEKKSKPSYKRGDIRMVDYGCSCSINECDAYKHLFQTEILGITAKVIGPLSLAAFQRIMTGFDLKMEHREEETETHRRSLSWVFLYQLRLLPFVDGPPVMSCHFTVRP